MPIVKNNVVFISYQLAFPDEDGQPDVVEIVDEKEPMVFIHGLSGLPEAFEKNLLGLNEGDTFDFSISAEDAYGNVDPNAIIQLPKSIFQAEDQSADDILQIGNFIPMTDDQGNRMQGLVVSIEGETVTMDFNHPLAEKTLMFQGKILKIREATPDELAHGHVHGEGGVHH
ncbi:peptidylprolyl isomerase [Aquirufa antheringensis]|jgi:FKBP-type peptidyl-prolyl cis-trans isomerase SlyD|uniref:FKBP-type peptidyl-prolyl cis-trans isomerase n=1 Tax=Aquirufa antheringensis TaxID=2516559 RepID=UPI0022A8971F|nr:peptidylprolyl isomerase [Aquirufa antheringensis]MCZ2476940.1 peptidylprolyl isomerase [Aquirufa antheringensis]